MPKQEAYEKAIKEFFKLINKFNENFTYWREGGEFVDCEVCGGLCREKTTG